MTTNSIDIDPILAQRFDAPNAVLLEQSIIAQANQSMSKPKSLLNRIPHLFAHRATPALATAMVIALSITLYKPVDLNVGLPPDLNSGLSQNLDSASFLTHSTQDQLTQSQASKLAELEFQEIWLLQDELALL